MSDFSHAELFPFCIGESNPSTENANFNSLFSFLGLQGYGQVYPIGMPLEDAMALYWRLISINWYWNQTITCECDGFEITDNEDYGSVTFMCADESSEFRPTGPSNNSVFSARVCPPHGHKLLGTITNYSEFCPPEGEPQPPPSTVTDSFYPMSCFFNPSSSGNYLTPINQSVKYRILKHNNLYYPSLLLAIFAYSRMYISQVFIAVGGNNVVSPYKNVQLTINGNNYSIQLFEVYNYTSSCIYDVNIGNITCNTI